MLNLFQNDSESGMIPFPEYFIRNLYVHRFRLSSRSADTRAAGSSAGCFCISTSMTTTLRMLKLRDATFRGNGSRPCSL